jgi:hypothetical protein
MKTEFYYSLNVINAANNIFLYSGTPHPKVKTIYELSHYTDMPH